MYLIDQLKKKFADLFKPADDAEYRTLMVGVWLDEATTAVLSEAYGKPLEDAHITLCYCGSVDEMAEENIARFVGRVAEYTGWQEALTGRLGGIGRFNASDSSDGRDVVYANVDVPGLDRLRHELMECARDCDCPISMVHGFTPHVTLEHIEPSADMPTTKLSSIDLAITHITVSVGEKKASFELGHKYRDEMRFYSDCSQSGAIRLFNDFEFAEPPEWINYLPIPKTYPHPVYGDVALTREGNALFADNFNNGVYQSEIPIDAEHNTKLSGAVGWVKEMRQNSDGSVDARVEWTDRGRSLIEADRFKYFSPEWYDNWQDPATEQVYNNVATGGAITTRPFFKNLRPLVASEMMTTANKGVDMSNDNQPNVTPQQFAELEAKVAKLTETLDATTAELDSKTAAEEAAQTQLQAYAEQNKQMAEQIAAMQTERRLARFSELVENDGNRWFGEKGTHVKVLDTLATTFGEDSDEFKNYVQTQTATAEQMAMSDLFTPKGNGSDKKGLNPFDVEVQKQMSEQGIDEPTATAWVMDKHPELYTKAYSEGGK